MVTDQTPLRVQVGHLLSFLKNITGHAGVYDPVLMSESTSRLQGYVSSHICTLARDKRLQVPRLLYKLYV